MKEDFSGGLVHLYTGQGKGKTTASLGLALRAIGHGYKVFMVQFLKGGNYTGELVTAKNFLEHLTIHQFGKGCIKEHKQMKLPGFGNGDMVRGHDGCQGCRYCFSIDEMEKHNSQIGLDTARKAAESGEYEIVIMDEVCGAINSDLIDIENVIDIIKSKHEKTELVLTGREAPEELKSVCDYVSVVEKIKHPFDKGVMARKGIEY